MPSGRTLADHLAACPAPASLPAQLVEKYSWNAMYDGGDQCKKDASSAKRTASLLAKTVGQFGQLTDSDRETLTAAAEAMRKLASDLVVLGAWAKRFKDHCDKTRRADRLGHFNQLAAARWSSTAERDFELSVAAELESNDGRVAFAAWQHGQNKYLDFSPKKFTFDDFRPGCYDNERDFPAHIKHLMALEAREFNNHHTFVGTRIYIQRPEFEKYLAFRRSVAEKTSSILSAAAEKPA